jgi:hypothetical protein
MAHSELPSPIPVAQNTSDCGAQYAGEPFDKLIVAQLVKNIYAFYKASDYGAW